MAGSRKDVRARLLVAALDLFAERGFDGTTTADIAQRANVAERTYFRHFSDKREPLFDGEDALQRDLTTAIATVPGNPPPLATLLEAFLLLVPSLESNHELKKRRQQVISATPELRERELTKEAGLVRCVAVALEDRHVRPPLAALSAASGVAVLSRVRLDRLGGNPRDYPTLLIRAFADLRAVLEELPPHAAESRQSVPEPG